MGASACVLGGGRVCVCELTLIRPRKTVGLNSLPVVGDSQDSRSRNVGQPDQHSNK